MSHSSAARGKEPQDDLSTPLPGAVTDKSFCANWLAMQCQIIGDVKCAMVLLGSPDGDDYEPAAAWPQGSNTELLLTSAKQCVKDGSALIIQRRTKTPADESLRDWYDVAYPIRIAGRLHGVVVIEVTARPAHELEAVLRKLSWGSAWLEVMLHRQNAVESVTHNERLQTLLDILATAMQRNSVYETATALVTDLATRLVCERVSLGFRAGDHIRLETISHNARFGKRAKLTRAIEAAMDEVLDHEAPVIFARQSDGSFPVNRRHEELARQHGAEVICSVPLGREGEIYGVLSFERLADQPFDASIIDLFEVIGTFVGPILELKQHAERPVVSHVTDTLRLRLAALMGPGHLAAKLAGCALVMLVVFSALAKGQYRIAARTLVEAQNQRVAVAPFNGYIGEARVRAGDLVRAGEILATLDDRERKLEKLKWSSQKEQYAKQYNLAMAQRNAAQVKITEAQIAQIDAELALVEDHLARTHLRAPIDGVIVSGDLSQSIGAPVERGQVLFEVAPLDLYRVILQVDESEAGEIARGQRGKIALSAFPTRLLPFTVQKITPVSASSEGRNYFRVEAAFDETPSQLRPGMEGVGKIDIASRRLIWIWTHRAVDWLRLLAWSWVP
jgi:RND family efflux transporter MFP subunit